MEIYNNELLETLWSPNKKINVTRGMLFAQNNPRLCPREIFKVLRNMTNSKGMNLTGDVSLQKNGFRVLCKALINKHSFFLPSLILYYNRVLLFSIRSFKCIGRHCSGHNQILDTNSFSMFIF